MQRSQLRELQKEGLASLAHAQGLASLGDPAHINPREDKLLAAALPEAHGRVITRGALAEAGRLGDDRVTLLVPQEAALLKAHGGSGAINPISGLREYEDDAGNGNPGGGHNADGPASSGGYGDNGAAGGKGASSEPGDGGRGGLGGGVGPGGFFSEGEDLSKESEIGYANYGNPEMGGGLGRSRGLASVDALGPAGKNVNTAAAAMHGYSPSFTDRAKDAFGWDSPGGVFSSPAANVALGLGVSSILGPAAGALASVAHNVGMRGLSLAETAPSAIGGYLAGGLGSIAGKTIGDAVAGIKSYDSPLSEQERSDRAVASLSPESAAGKATGAATGGATAGAGAGAGAGTSYVMDAPTPSKSTTSSTARTQVARADGWDEDDFLNRNPEVAKAVSNGTWASGQAFNEAYRAQAGASYEAAKAVGAVSPYTDQTLKTRPGQAVFPTYA